MVQEYIQNSVELLANELKRYITTWWQLRKLEKPFALFVTSKKLKESVSSVGFKLTSLRVFFVENKDWTKAEIGQFSF